MKVIAYLLLLIIPSISFSQLTDGKTIIDVSLFYGAITVNQSVYLGNVEELKQRAKNKQKLCKANDPTCQGYKLGISKIKPSSVTIKHNIATKQCANFSEPVLVTTKYTCYGTKDTCATELPRNCSIRLDNCNGTCKQTKFEYKCTEYKYPKLDKKCQAIKCKGKNCPSRNTKGTNTKDLKNSLAMLETGRQIVKYFDPNNANIFTGKRSECRYKVAWGLSNCCSGSHGNSKTSNKYALAQLGVSYAIRNVSAVGNPHTHDILFLTQDLKSSLAGLGSGKAFTSFSPSLSYYGLNVSLTKGVISFGFDPASFAVAVALAVIANLIKCSSDEKLLGMKIGANLCVAGGRWCSKRRFFFCKERKQSYCCYNSRLAKTISSQAKQQLNINADHCGGFSQSQINSIDFDKIDLSSVINDFNAKVDQKLVTDYVNNNKKIAKTKVNKAK